MTDDEALVMAIVEEVLDSSCTADEACRECPELLPAVRERLNRFRLMEAHVAEVFPPPNGSPDFPRGFLRRSAQSLPRIPGYEVLELVGSGGMGAVYKARHLKLRRLVAIKVLLAGCYAGQRDLERFKREAESIAALSHANIVQVFDAGEWDGCPYFVMEFIGGGALTEALGSTPLPARQAAASGVVLARAVHFAHERGIIHRDLKPGNVLLVSDGTLKIADFGLAGRLEAADGAGITLDGGRMGTPSYMAPEQALGQIRTGTRGFLIDVYGVGAILYEMLTGRPPFRAESVTETERQVICDEPVGPSRLNPRTPRDLETICLKCLQKTPEQRYESAAALADDLDRFLAGEAITARRVGRIERCARWVRRNPTRVALLLSMLSLLGLTFGYCMREWVLANQRQLEKARLTTRLESGIHLEQQGRLAEAGAILRELGDGGFEDLRHRIDKSVAEIDLISRFGEMRLGQRASADLEFDRDKWWRQYRRAFTEAGLLADDDLPAAFAARVARSPVRAALVAAMDDMSICATNQTDLDWLFGATRIVDPDPWRDRARDTETWTDATALASIVSEADIERQPVTLLLIVAGRLMNARPDDATSLIRRVQAAHPTDFWANFALGEVLGARKDPDAIGFYRAAIAVRPDAAAAHVNLGLVLEETQHRRDEAIDAMSRAVALDPRSEVAQYNLAAWLLARNRTDEALVHARIAAELDPGRSLAHRVLGRALAMSGKYCEAAESFRRALELKPGDANLQAYLAKAQEECKAASKEPR